MNTLKITHDAGFFSCCSKRLEGIVWFFNKYKHLPDRVDSSEQFSFYRSGTIGDAASLYFTESGNSIQYVDPIVFYNDMQFLPYQRIDFTALQPFVQKYFSPTGQVQQAVLQYEQKYHIDYDNTCVVFYRGNDKGTETPIASYEIFITKAQEIKKEHPTVNFLIQTDEMEFVEAFLREFPGSIWFEEVPPISKQNSFIAAELASADQVAHGTYFLASILALSKCKYLIIHSGNGSLWCLLYRGNMTNVFQWLDGTWNSTAIGLSGLWQINKRHIKRFLRKPLGWHVIQS